VKKALNRAKVYAGADGLFIPSLINIELLEGFSKSSPLPVNIMLNSSNIKSID